MTFWHLLDIEDYCWFIWIHFGVWNIQYYNMFSVLPHMAVSNNILTLNQFITILLSYITCILYSQIHK